MNNENKSNNNQNTGNRVPMNPYHRIPLTSSHRVPMNPYHRMDSQSGQFFDKFTKFKNTESNWNVMGFSK